MEDLRFRGTTITVKGYFVYFYYDNKLVLVYILIGKSLVLGVVLCVGASISVSISYFQICLNTSSGEHARTVENKLL